MKTLLSVRSLSYDKFEWFVLMTLLIWNIQVFESNIFDNLNTINRYISAICSSVSRTRKRNISLPFTIIVNLTSISLQINRNFDIMLLSCKHFSSFVPNLYSRDLCQRNQWFISILKKFHRRLTSERSVRAVKKRRSRRMNEQEREKTGRKEGKKFLERR